MALLGGVERRLLTQKVECASLEKKLSMYHLDLPPERELAICVEHPNRVLHLYSANPVAARFRIRKLTKHTTSKYSCSANGILHMAEKQAAHQLEARAAPSEAT